MPESEFPRLRITDAMLTKQALAEVVLTQGVVSRRLTVIAVIGVKEVLADALKNFGANDNSIHTAIILIVKFFILSLLFVNSFSPYKGGRFPKGKRIKNIFIDFQLFTYCYFCFLKHKSQFCIEIKPKSRPQQNITPT